MVQRPCRREVRQMASSVLLGNVVRRLNALGAVAVSPEAADAGLLERFILHRDEAAFAGLLRRHGPMVFSVCRHILNHPHDVEDAFQAAFLVLVQRASSIRRHGSLASWLYGVALRTARRALLGATRRRQRERRAAMAPAQAAADGLTWSEVRAVLHEEIERLPEKYRAPLVLCYLEGQTNARAARQLGVPAGSLSKRLERARGLLRGRLLRRGVSVPATALLALPAGDAGAVPPVLVRQTMRSAGQCLVGPASSGAATALADGVVRTLAAGQATTACAWLLALGTLVAAGAWLVAGRGDAKPPQAERREPVPARPAPPLVDRGPRDLPADWADVKRRLLQ
ncbi:MAG TPA: sigma-70 family RNA polymerase sigma factor, partial [Gemmataceae bacterium]|nr:sigma-70 family RNA polymerase sigma factor [Gemmataceae bacterium]